MNTIPAPNNTEVAELVAGSIIGSRSIPSILRDGAARHPDRPFLLAEAEDGTVSTFTWERLLTGACGAAEHLRGLGIERGARVHVHLPNRPEFILVWFALAELGATMVPTNTVSSPHEIGFAIEHADTVASVTDADGEPAVTEALRVVDRERPVVTVEGARLLERACVAPAMADIDPRDELGILYTSGTTSRPKGVCITHANYVFSGEAYSACMRLTAEDRILMCLPLFHANSQFYSVMGALVSGATVILLPRFSASRWGGQAVRHRATIANLFAAPVRMIIAQEPQASWRENCLRAVMFAQNLTDDEVRRWDDMIGAPLIQGYGMTETGGPPLMGAFVGPRRADAVGRPTLGYFCKLLAEDGSPAKPGEPGELLVRGTPGISLMAGYLNDPAATALAIQDGWLHTGDLLFIAEDGLFQFVDRRKDMIKRAGENVAASEVELVLLDHPGVRDTAVVGVPDPMRDEMIVGFVVGDASLDPGELIEWCRERLAKFRVPSVIEIVPELPRTSVGKIQKHVLRMAWLDHQGSPSGS